MQPYPVVAADVLLKIGTAIILPVLSLYEDLSQKKNFPCPQILLPACALLTYSVFLVRIFIAKCFTYSSKQFLCEVMFENEHTFCLWIQYVHTHRICPTGVSNGLATAVTLTRVSRGRSEEPITRGWTCFRFHFCTAVCDCWVAF
jgi:hypothetical protein